MSDAICQYLIILLSFLILMEMWLYTSWRLYWFKVKLTKLIIFDGKYSKQIFLNKQILKNSKYLNQVLGNIIKMQIT